MNIDAELVELQAEAESMMTDTCIVTRAGDPSGSPDLDPVTGMYPPTATQVVYQGKCSMRVPGSVSAGKTRPSAGDSAALLLTILGIPVSAPTLAVNDDVRLVASQHNPALVGLKYGVTGLLPSTFVTKQKVSVVAVVD